MQRSRCRAGSARRNRNDVPVKVDFLPGHEASAVPGVGVPKNTTVETHAMNFILTFLGSVIGAAAGYAAASAFAYAIAGTFGMSDFEGGRAMFAAFFAGPIGGIAGFIVGIWLPLRLRGSDSLLAVLGYSVLSIVATGVVAAAVAGYI
jgi:hypothetical protein